HDSRSGTKALLLRYVRRRCHLQPARQPARRHSHVPSLVFLRSLGHRDRSTNSAPSLSGGTVPPPVRPDEVSAHPRRSRWSMLHLRRILRNYEEGGALNSMVNLFGFVGPEVFLTKTGEPGIVLELQGVDYECLDQAAIDIATKRLESALRLFDEHYRVYQLLFKSNCQFLPRTFCGNVIMN